MSNATSDLKNCSSYSSNRWNGKQLENSVVFGATLVSIFVFLGQVLGFIC